MLERRVSPQGPVYYISPSLQRLGVSHAFSTRLGGVSPPPFDSLNLGNPSGCAVQDDYERIYENYRSREMAIGCDGKTRLWVHATSLGGVESTFERRRRWRSEPATIPDGLVRMSVGIEDVDDLWDDLAAALVDLTV